MDQASQSGRKRRGSGVLKCKEGKAFCLYICVYSMPFLSRLENREAGGYDVVKWGGVGFTALREEEMC